MTNLAPEFQQKAQRYSATIGRPIDNTALSAYTKCPRLYQYSMVENRRSNGLPSQALHYGSMWHVAMETHYKSPECDRDTLQQNVEQAVMRRWQLPPSDDYRTMDRVFVEYGKYLKQYGLPWKEEAKTLGWPTTPMVELAVEMPIPGARHPYIGKLDRIIKENNHYYVEDHKTTARFDVNYFRQWELDNQMIGYATLAGILIGEPILGVRINLHVCRKSDSVFERRTIQFSKPRIDDWMKNYDFWLQRLETEHEAYANGLPWAFPHNFSACAGKYGMCSYASICGTAPSVRQIGLEQDFPVSPWNPLTADDDASE